MTIDRQHLLSLLGSISVSFAKLEYLIQGIIGTILFNDDWVSAGIVLDNNVLRKNLEILKKLTKRQANHEEKLLRLYKQADDLRLKRNLFIHGVWMIEDQMLNKNEITVYDRKVKVRPDLLRRELRGMGGILWSHGKPETYSFEDLQKMEAGVIECVKLAEKLQETLTEEKLHE